MLPIKKLEKPVKGFLSERGLIEERDIGNGLVLRVESDDWGKYIRVVDKDKMTLLGHLVVNEYELEAKIEIVKELFQ